MPEHQTSSTNVAGLPLLAALRALLPTQPVTLGDFLTLTTSLSRAFRTLSGVSGDHLPTSTLESRAVVRIEETELPVSGFSYWDPGARQWVIALNEDESDALHRFTMFHEFGHIIWDQAEHLMYAEMPRISHDRFAEIMADLFAFEVLMPRASVERLVGDGVIDVATLARRFEVTRSLMRLRLNDLDLQAVMPTEQARRSFWRPRPPLLVGDDVAADHAAVEAAS